MNARLTVSISLALLLALPAQAAMYKWVDKDGSIVYSEMPPPGAQNVQSIAPPPRPPEAPAPAEKADAPTTGTGPVKPVGVNDTNVEVRRQFEEVRRKNCELAKQNLETYRTARRVLTPEQEVVVLDDATRAARIKQAEEDIATYCK
jgi:hypothetical protein